MKRSPLVATLALLACSAAPAATKYATSDEDPSRVERLEAAHGGPGGLMRLFDEASDSTIAAALRAHDIGFARNGPLTACERTFPAAARSSWQAFDGEFYFIEEHGRPNRAYKYLPPIAEAPRITGCQAEVGRWGDDADGSNDYDGGHMIGSQLGGYGGRINLVPQDLNFNRGNWAQIENKVAECGALPDERLFYYVRADYGNETSVVPTAMSLTLENRETGESATYTFENQDAGGPTGTDQRVDAVAFLTAQGCNAQ